MTCWTKRPKGMMPVVVSQRPNTLARRTSHAEAEAGSVSDADRARLAAELDAARARERELEAAGAEASQALAEAIAQLRTVLGDQDGQKEG